MTPAYALEAHCRAISVQVHELALDGIRIQADGTIWGLTGAGIVRLFNRPTVEQVEAARAVAAHESKGLDAAAGLGFDTLTLEARQEAKLSGYCPSCRSAWEGVGVCTLCAYPPDDLGCEPAPEREGACLVS